MNALHWITKEAKKLKRKYPRRFTKWTDYVSQASAIYAKKHKGRSPVGHKKRRRKMGGSIAPAVNTYSPKKRRAVSGVRTTSRTHTDKNRITANIQVGALKSELKKRLTEKRDYLILRRYHADLKREKRKISKQIAAINRELKKYE